MKKVYTMKKQLMLLAIAACAVSPMAVPTEARTASPLLSGSNDPFHYAPESSSLAPQWKSQAANARARFKAQTTKTEADFAFAPSDDFSFLQLPDGTSWYILSETDKDIVSQSEYYTEYSITGVHATIYDENFQPVGKIDHTVETPEGYGSCTALNFGLVATKKFFNTDNNYEVMLMLNYRPAEGYGAQAFTYVYSLRGSETSAVFVDEIKGYYTTAVNDAQDSWSENFFMTFFSGETLTDDELREEMIMTRLRTRGGIPLEEFRRRFGAVAFRSLLSASRRWVAGGLMEERDGTLALSRRGVMVSDEIIVSLF